MDSLRALIQKFPKDGDDTALGGQICDLGTALEDIGDYAGAENVHRDGIRRAPKCIANYVSLASLLCLREDYIAAESVLQKGNREEGDGSGLCYFRLGFVRWMKGDDLAAEQAYRMSASKDPSYPYTYLHLADRLIEQGDMLKLES